MPENKGQSPQALFGGGLRERRQQRLQARKQLMQVAMDVYEDGDDAQELKLKVEQRIAKTVPDKPWAAFLMKIFEQLLPLLLRLLTGV